MSEIQSNKYFFFQKLDRLSNRGADVHYHSYFEIYHLTSGGCDSFIDDKLYNLKPGDIVIIPPGAIHGTRYTTERHGRALINFTVHYIPERLIDMLSKETYVYKCDDAQNEIEHVFAQLEKEYHTTDHFSEDAIRALMAQLIIIILRHAQKNDDIVVQNSLIENALRYIRENYQNSISLTEIADECNVSKVHLSRKFKEKTGVGLNEYMVIFRLKKAKEFLLTRDKMSICEVAFHCGFNDSNYFSWLFKKTYGVTPSQYRKNTRA